MNHMYQMISSYEFRRRAREAMKPVFQFLLVISLIASLPNLINTTVTLLTGADPSVLLDDLYEKLNKLLADSGLTGTALNEAVLTLQNNFLADMLVFLQEKGLLIAGLALMEAVLSPVLTLCLIGALLSALRKEEFTVLSALGRCKYALKALGVSLMTGLIVAGWMLPGMAVMLLAVFLSVFGLPAILSELLMTAGMIAMLIMGLMAALRYALAMFILADYPKAGVLVCLKRSRLEMQHHRMELLSLRFSYMGWYLLVHLVQSLAIGLFGSVIGMTVGMMCNLVLTVYINCGVAAFYEAYAVHHEQYQPPQNVQETPEDLI